VLSTLRPGHLRSPSFLATSPEVTRTGSAGWTNDRTTRLQTFVADLSGRLQLHRVPVVEVVDTLKAGSAQYDELTHRILVPKAMLGWDGERVKKLLTHEVIHAWQNETGTLRWNLDQVGHYVDAPSGSLSQILIRPNRLARLITYALQPSELHAELARMTRELLHALPPAPW
jgi:hypothetical protein